MDLRKKTEFRISVEYTGEFPMTWSWKVYRKDEAWLWLEMGWALTESRAIKKAERFCRQYSKRTHIYEV